MDSIQEFQVASSNYSAELGQARRGGVVNAVTKSGTNAIHGDLFFTILRYPTLNALDSLQKSRGNLYSADSSTTAVWRQRWRTDYQGQAVYFLTYDGSRRKSIQSATPVRPFSRLRARIARLPRRNARPRTNTCPGLLGAYPRSKTRMSVPESWNYLFTPANRVSASFNLDNFKAPNSYNTATTSNANSNTANGTAVTREPHFRRELGFHHQSDDQPISASNGRRIWRLSALTAPRPA